MSDCSKGEENCLSWVMMFLCSPSVREWLINILSMEMYLPMVCGV